MKAETRVTNVVLKGSSCQTNSGDVEMYDDFMFVWIMSAYVPLLFIFVCLKWKV
jgi:hypothetical protein